MLDVCKPDNTANNNTVALIGCGSSKVDLDEDEKLPAIDLYDSNYFGLKREYGEELCDDIFILSAEHRVLPPNEKIGTYDASLTKRSDSYIGDDKKKQWGIETAQELEAVDSEMPENTVYVMLAGEDYITPLEDSLRAYRVEYPFRIKTIKGIGDQMGWLRSEIDEKQSSNQTEFSDF